MSSAVHLVTARRPDGQRAQAVLRRYVRPDPDEPDPAAREARALRLAGAADVPTPALLAVDPDGTQAGVPALLMSRLPGRVDWWPSDLDRWLERLAGAAAAYPRHGAAAGRGGPPLRPLPAGELPAARLGAVPAGLGAGRRDQPGPRPGPARRAAAPRLPPGQRAVALRPGVRGGGLARRLLRARAGRRGALPDKPADDGDRGRVALHGSLGTGGRHRRTTRGATWSPSSASSTTCTTTGAPSGSLVEDMLARAIAELAG